MIFAERIIFIKIEDIKIEMKKIFLAIAFVLLLNMPVLANTYKPHITAYGTATVEVIPDEMFWSLKITNKGPDIKEIAKQHSNIVLSVLSFLDETEVDKNDTQTSMMQFGENLEYVNGRRVQKGYFASSQVTFKLIIFNRYQHLWRGLSKIENTSIQNIVYGYSKRTKAQNRAMINALLAAKEKAQTMAKALSVNLGDPLVIEEQQSSIAPMRSKMLLESNARAGASQKNKGGFALGKILIKSNVKVVYLIKL